MEIYRDSRKNPRERAEDLLSRMTLREKVGQLNQRLYGFSCYERRGDQISLTKEFREEVERFEGLGVLYGLYRADPWSQKDFSNGLSGILMKKAYNLAQRYVMEHSRFGIPMLLSTECPHGHQALDGYLLPVNLAAGASWDPDLLRRAYEVCGKQLKELGVGLALISMLDVLRDPRWGRSEECYSEDPYLSAALAKQAVMGCQSQGVAVVAKHFCAQGETTGGVNASAARIGPRELREIHLPPMKACCEAGVQGVMAAYNEIDGVPCHANRELLRDILRGELGFTGLVMADGTALDRLDALTEDPAASGAMALEAGVDVSLWDTAFSRLEEAVGRGLVSEREIDRACLRVLTLKFERGLFERPFLEETPPKIFSYEEYPESLELARESIVLLKNEDLLPLPATTSKIGVIGPNADDLYRQLGDYTPPQRDGAVITLLEGLRWSFPGQVRGEDRAGIQKAAALAGESDVVILALGGSSSRFAGARFDVNGAAVLDGPVQMDCGEGVDCSALRLPGAQEELAEAVFAAGKPVITVIIGGRPYAIPEICEKSQAVLYAFYPGPMGGKALAEIISGEISPSGRLPVSLPRSAGQLPCYYNPKASYSAMRYADEKDGALYPFGWGLSCTEFVFSGVRFPETVSVDELKKTDAECKFAVKNVGNRDAWAVPQLFLRGLRGGVTRRVKELKGFCRVFLRAGEERECVLALNAADLSLWDRDMKFTLEPGKYELFLEEGGKRVFQKVFILA